MTVSSESMFFKFAFLAACFAISACSSKEKPKPVPPVDFALRYQNDHLFRESEGFRTSVPEFYSYQAPLDGSDCNKGKAREKWYWQLDGEDPNEDYVELTISDYLGVPPGQSRAYTLVYYGTQTVSYDLIFAQQPGASNLNIMTWRFFVSAPEDIPNEHGDGSSNSAPPIGEIGFSRAWKGPDRLVGGHWELRPADNFDLRGITARLHVRVDNGGVKVCR